MNNKELGAICRAYRESLGLLQSDVAKDVNYSKENVSAFENGRNNNARILQWYLEHGLIIKDGR